MRTQIRSHLAKQILVGFRYKTEIALEAMTSDVAYLCKGDKNIFSLIVLKKREQQFSANPAFFSGATEKRIKIGMLRQQREKCCIVIGCPFFLI